MGVRQPGVQGHQGGLDPKTDQEKGTGDQQDGGRGRNRCNDLIQLQRANLGKYQGDTNQHEHRPGGALNQVLDAGFQRSLLIPVKGHQRIRGDGHGFEPHPQVEQVAGAAQPDDRSDHGYQQGIILFFVYFSEHVAGGENHHHQTQHQHRKSQQQADAIHAQEDRANR